MAELSWTEPEDDLIREGRRQKISYAEMAKRINLEFGRNYSRDAVKSRWDRIKPDRVRKPLRDYSAEVSLALHIRATERVSWDDIARRVNVSRETLKRLCRPDYDAQQRANQQNRAKRIREGVHSPRRSESYHDVERSEPRNPIFDPRRDGTPEHPTLTAALMGDPFPGRADIMRRLG